ncbi:Uncharacterised protein [uncultured archaeon]|nr:Uncharacterised protein [uncultured archaeon]
MKKFNKKGIDTKAINLILSAFVIFIVIIIFYIWAGKNMIEKQSEVIEGDYARIQIDQALATLAYERPKEMIINAEQSFKNQFTQQGITVESIQCKPERCEFKLKRGTTPTYSTDYQRTIYLPGKEITFTGRMNYE